MYLCKLFVSFSCFTFLLSKNEGVKLNSSYTNLTHGSNMNNYEKRIFEGHYVKDIKEYPFMVFVCNIISETSILMCGGSIISPSHVLTAAHCVVTDLDEAFPLSQFKIFVGSVSAMFGSEFTIKAIYTHPQYQEYRCPYEFDVAILELDQPLTFNETISPVVLPEPLPLDWLGNEVTSSSKTTSYIETEKNCKVLGWGMTNASEEFSAIGRELKEAEVPLISIQKCHDVFPKLCKGSQICSMDPENKTGVCSGDSGGPIICDGVQVGLMSYVINESCVGPNLANVYTRVDVYMKFINEVMAGNKSSSDFGNSLFKLLYLICIIVIHLL